MVKPRLYLMAKIKLYLVAEFNGSTLGKFSATFGG